MSWLQFAAVIAAFFLTHTVPVRPAIRKRLVNIAGPRGFTAAYSLLSLAMLSAVIAAAAHAPVVLLWLQAPWHKPVVMAGMLGVCVILAFAIGQPNPFSFGGARNDLFDPRHPGIVRWLRHPVLAALALWAGLHLLPNGDLAHVTVFGIFAAFALLGRSLINRRKKREMTEPKWQDLYTRTMAAPVLPAAANRRWVLGRVLGAGCAYVALLLLHALVLGVPVVLL